ncbi:uncharacterized protein EI97DRAFT_458209 [Westerdykella ornata]|uniref:Uncharacterized protein n=1 Tax=Westerdykella ornata TaxID=318751 RepID=A0A6A6JKX4_WESOR|nr:uncharacterized protein EI97DRAFT_458209 [Westerdykella ornata]KAF2276885.1 hypothetical protein EI97DRAFT_458209 [Westerdykella ornata]
MASGFLGYYSHTFALSPISYEAAYIAWNSPASTYLSRLVCLPKPPVSLLQEFVLEFLPETADERWFFLRDDAAIEATKTDPKYAYFWEEYQDELKAPTRLTYDDERVYKEGPVWVKLARRNRSRSVPDRETFHPLLLYAATALQRLKELRKFILRPYQSETHLHWPNVVRLFELCHLRAGTARSPSGSSDDLSTYPRILHEAKHINHNRVYWRTGKWRPWTDVDSAWRSFAGDEARIVFLDEEKWTRKGVIAAIYRGEL